MIPRPLYRKPVRMSRASYSEEISANSKLFIIKKGSYHIMFEISSELPVFHLMNFPGLLNVHCDASIVSVRTDHPEIIDEWSDLEQVILIMDFYECPMQDSPFHVAKNWRVVGNNIHFDIVQVSKADMDVSINVLIHPLVNNKQVFTSLHDQGIDSYLEMVRQQKTEDKTLTYPYKFKFNSDKNWNIGATGGFIKCETCNVIFHVMYRSMVK
jgi:hypothetical protein